MESTERIALIGFMGSGKTAAGKILAESIGFRFIDLDRMIEKKLSKSIADIFKEKGEEYFRKLESEALLELSQKTQIVLSCGGGIVELEENRRILKSKFFVVYLDAPWEIIWKRIKDDASRPKAIAPEAMVKSLFLRRKPLYEETADLTLKCGKKSETEIAEEVRGHLSGW